MEHADDSAEEVAELLAEVEAEVDEDDETTNQEDALEAVPREEECVWRDFKCALEAAPSEASTPDRSRVLLCCHRASGESPSFWSCDRGSRSRSCCRSDKIA